MKKTILSLLIVVSAGLSAKAQVDFTVNPFFLLIPAVQVSVEFNTKKDWGIAGEAFAGEGGYAIYASARHFFNPSKGGDRFNMGTYLGSIGGEGDTGFGLGFLLGYKAISSQKIVFDIAIGGGRDFTDNIEFLPYFKANIGYRFGLKAQELKQ